MTSPFLGQIQAFAFNFAPYQWAMCSGQLVPIQQNAALYSLLGTTYGGNGTNNFQLPNLAARALCNQGTGPGLSQRVIGETFGEMEVTLSSSEMPQHIHTMSAWGIRSATNKVAVPVAGAAICGPGGSTYSSAVGASSNTSLAPSAVGTTGGNLPHENRQPFVAITYGIALSGAFPSFN